MRILLASDHYPPFIGGAHRQVALLGQELRARGHQVAVVTIAQTGLPAEEMQGGVSVSRFRQIRSLLPHRNDGRQKHHPPFADPLVAWKLRGLLRSFRPDVVHAYGWISYSCALALALRGSDAPLVVSARDYAYSCASRTMMRGASPCSGPALGKCLVCAARHYGVGRGVVAAVGVRASARPLRGRVHGVHSISSYVQEVIRRDFTAGGGRAPASRISEAVIPSFRQDAEVVDGDLEGYLEQLPEERFILFVGAIRQVKGIDVLLSAYRTLVDPPPLVLLGTVERDSPVELPANVSIACDFPHSAVLAAMDRSLFAVFPSLWPEPLGSVVHEAMSRGRAVIGTRPGGHEDMIVDGETGRLVARGDVAALADAMRQLLDEPQTRERFGEAGLRRSALFTAAAAVPRFEAFYREVIAAGSDRASASAPDPTRREDR